MNNNQRQCEGTRKDGKPCQGWAGSESRFCFVHDPVRARQRTEARRKGGLHRGGIELPTGQELVDERYRTLPEIEALLQERINAARRLNSGWQKERTLGFLIGQWAKLYELGEMEERLAAVEQRLGITRL